MLLRSIEKEERGKKFWKLLLLLEHLYVEKILAFSKVKGRHMDRKFHNSEWVDSAKKCHSWKREPWNCIFQQVFALVNSTPVCNWITQGHKSYLSLEALLEIFLQIMYKYQDW